MCENFNCFKKLILIHIMHILYTFLYQGVKPAKSLPLTQPQSPAFALRQRVRLPMPKEEEEEVCVSNVTLIIEISP